MYLVHVRQACALLDEFMRDKSFADYQADALLRSAVERQFIIIGEALTQAKDPALDQAITELRQIVAFRNILVHGYAVVQNRTVWDAIHDDLPLLKQQVEDFLSQVGPP
jgi:uncharacterized protein with HEPN domain